MVNRVKVLQGDIVLLKLDPILGSEQKRTRPALVVSANAFNKVQKMVFICPITNSERNYPTHVSIGQITDISGNIMCEQLRAIDKDERIISRIGRVDNLVLGRVLSIVNAIIYDDC